MENECGNYSERLQQLVLLQLDGRATPADQRELAALLEEFDHLQQQYIEFIQDTASLRWWSAKSAAEVPNGSVETASSGVTQSRKSGMRMPRLKHVVTAGLAIAAAIFVIAIVLLPGELPQQVMLKGSPERSSEATSVAATPSDIPAAQTENAFVATVTRLHAVQWSSQEVSAKELSRLTVGQTLQFVAGEVEIVFDRAVQLVVRGPASLKIRSDKEIYSPYGAISARVGESGKGFVIETPSGRITDLGTEFGVSVNKRGATDVAVFRGAVDLSYGPRSSMVLPSVSRRLVQGQALRLDSNGNMRRLVAVDGARFPDVYGSSYFVGGGKSSIFTNVRDNIRDGVEAKFYRIVPGGLREDVPAYVDRQHEWNGVDGAGIPELLVGADYIMPFNEDKYMPTLEVTLSIGRPVELFVFLSDIAKVPEWLSRDFVNTGLKIGLDETAEFSNPKYRLAIGPGEEVDTRFAVWKRTIAAPSSVTLGSIKQGKRGWGYCMYGIAAIPLETHIEQLR